MIIKLVVCGLLFSMHDLVGTEEGEALQQADENSGGGLQLVRAEDTAGSQASSTTPVVQWKELPAATVPHNPFRGNWFKKRTLVQEARQLYETIHDLVVQHWEPGFQNFLKVYEAQTPRMKDQIIAIGFSLETVAEFMKQPEAADERVAQLLSEAHSALEVMRDVQNNVNAAIDIARQQLTIGGEYEKSSWQQYEQIDKAYDDIDAAQLYDAMRAAHEHLVKLLGEYLQQQLVPYTQQLVQQFDLAVQSLEKIKKSLKAHDIYLVPSERPAVVEKPAPSAPPVQKWYIRAWALVIAPLYTFWGWIMNMWKWLTGAK